MRRDRQPGAIRGKNMRNTRMRAGEASVAAAAGPEYPVRRRERAYAVEPCLRALTPRTGRPEDTPALKVHFIGIAGTGMGALAGLLREAGHVVRGSDAAVYPPMSTQLAQAQIPVFEGFSPANLDWGPERVVVGNVCSADHPEVRAARQRGIPLESFPSMLASTFLGDRSPYVVAGTHGKTTTASALAWVLTVAGEDVRVVEFDAREDRALRPVV